MESFVSLSNLAASLRSDSDDFVETTVDVPPTVERALPRFGLDFASELDLDPVGPGAFLGRSARAKTRDERIVALESWTGYDRSSAADPFGVQLSRATWAAQLRLDPQRAYVPPTTERFPVALCAADLGLIDRLARRVQLDRTGRVCGARQNLADARSALLLARSKNDAKGIEAGIVWEAQALDALRDARHFVVESARSGMTAADLTMHEDAVLQELCQDPPKSAERDRELARLVQAQRRAARADKVALHEAKEAESLELEVPVATEGSNAEALAAES